MSNDVSKSLKKYRKKHNLSQKELSTTLKCSISTISKIERGETTPGIRLTNKIESLLKIEEAEEFLSRLEKLMNRIEKTLSLAIIKTSKIKKISQSKINSLKNDLNSTSTIITKLWELNDETDRIFSELDLLLSINPEEENVKMRKGLEKIGNNLISKGEKLIKYTKKQDSSIKTVN